jgi:transcriptional regulator with XRE-family HTH domain
MPRQELSNRNSDSFGEYIRSLREDRNLPLRKVAAALDIDTSTLSKIEKNERNANEEIIQKLASVFNVDKGDLRVRYMSDKITYQLIDEKDGMQILKVAEQKIRYFKQRSPK